MGLVADLEAVKAKIEERLLNATLSEPINGVVIGERTKKHKVKPPMIWIVLMPAGITDESFALSEFWRWRLLVISVIKEFDPAEGKTRAENLALSASGKPFLYNDAGTEEDRSLGGLVDDIVRIRWEPAHERIMDQDPSLFGSAVELELRFQNQEV